MCLAGCGIKLNPNQCTIGNGRHTIRPSGTVVTEVRNGSGFSGIAAETGIKVTVEQSDSWKVVVEADENVIRFVDAKVAGSTLNIHYADRVTIKGPTETHVKVWCPQIRSLSVSSAAEIRTAGTIEGDHLLMDASSAGSISADLNYEKVTVTASSAARINLSGECSAYRAEMSSAAEVSAAKLLSESAYVDSSSAAKASVFANDCLQMDVSSGGSVTYYGRPYEIDQDVSSGGSIRRGK